MTLDRYVIRQTLAPTALALVVFTFLLAINPMLDYLKDLLAKGLTIGTVAYLLGQLVWQALGQALPMALLTGLLIALGRMSADREGVALLASGVSPLRLVRPVLALGLVVGLADFYVLAKVVPDGNQRFREVTFPLVMSLGERDIKPGVFFEHFPGLVIYVREQNPAGGWNDVLLAETASAGPPVLTLASHGRLVLDERQRLVRLLLTDAVQYVPGTTGGAYSVNVAAATDFKISPELVFGPGRIVPGIKEKRIPELQREIAARRARGESAHPEIIQLHQMFAFPAACLVFAVVALGLGLNTRRDGKFASLALGLGVLVVYYAFLVLAESRVKGDAALGARSLPAAWARWIPNIALTLIGVLALRWRMRGPRAQSAVGRLADRVAARFRKASGAFEAGPRPDRRSAPAARRSLAAIVFPRLLDQYVGGRYWKTITLTFAGLLFLVYVFTFLDLSDKIFKGHADGWMFLQFLWFSTPQFVVLVLPFATLLATLATMGGLARTSELTVMRAAGVSLYRTAAPVVLGACVLSVGLFALDERVLAASNLEAARLENVIRDRPSHTLDARNQSWFADRGRVYHYAAFDERAQGLLGLSVFEFTVSPFRMTSHTYVNRAVYGSGGWRADAGWMQRFGAAEQARQELAGAPLELAPIEDFRSARVDPRRLSFRELLAYNRKLGAAGFNVREHEVNLHRKIAFPIAAVILTILAVPLGAVSGRHGALYGMGLAIVLAVIYFLAQTVFLAAGTAGMLPTALAAWGANLLFLFAAVYMLLTVRT
jgi:LPS export ABC transporter permease LptG/LPS export ABC transporter permease LptF